MWLTYFDDLKKSCIFEKSTNYSSTGFAFENGLSLVTTGEYLNIFSLPGDAKMKIVKMYLMKWKEGRVARLYPRGNFITNRTMELGITQFLWKLGPFL